MDRYEQDYPLTYSENNYALCFRCHNPRILMSSSSAFPPHESHVTVEGVPCSVCHDPHGIPLADGGSIAGNAHLINFDKGSRVQYAMILMAYHWRTAAV
jgi:hypothetical protein